MVRLNFENPVFKPILALFFASSFNDWWAITIGIPTPVQLALFYGIYTFVFSYKITAPNLFLKIKGLMLFYLTVITVSTCSLIYFSGDLDITVFTILINMLWLITSLPFLSIGFTNEDILLFLKYVSYIIFFITIPFGMYEFITHKSFLNTNYGLSEGVFYVRGLHIDKIEYASMLSLGVFIGVASLGKKIKEFPLVYIYMLIFLCVLLIVISYSTTAIMGLVLGTALILLQGVRKGGGAIFLVGLVFFIAFEIISTTDLFKNLLSSYDLKYELNVTQATERNYRYMSWDAAIRQIEENPIWGYGIGHSGKVVQAFFIKDLNYFTNQYINLSKEVNTHNLFFNELLDYGIIGALPLFIILVFFYYYVFSGGFQEYSNEVDLLNKLVLGLSVLLAFRFVLYYHRFDQSIYLLWASLLMGLRATKIMNQNV